MDNTQPDNKTASGDLHLECQQCGSSFLFSAREQSFFEEMGFVPPRYCPSCRRLRKQEGNRSGTWKDTYDVKCARCGAMTTVPFKPVNGRPVYCRSCLSEVREERGEHLNGGHSQHLPGSFNGIAQGVEVHGIGLTYMDDAARPYEKLDDRVEALLDSLFNNSGG